MANDLDLAARGRAGHGPSRCHSMLGWALRGCIVGVLLGAGIHFGYVLLGSNFRTVVPGCVYRCAQPSAQQLERFIHEHGIRTVINLRGCCIGADWYQDEARITGAMGVSLEDLGFSAGRLPSTVGLQQLVEVLDRSEYPVLLHCHQGADRTGLAAVVYLLLHTNLSLPEAKRHLGLRSGHLPLGRTRDIDRFFRLYERWLAGRDREHSPGTFRLWVRDHYCPGEGRAEFVLVRPPSASRSRLHLRPGIQHTLTVRCINRSIRAWQLHPGPNAGTHLVWYLIDDQERVILEGRAGLFEATINPGEHVDLMISLPELPPGRFQLRVDLFNAQHGTFLQLGNDPLLLDMEVS